MESMGNVCSSKSNRLKRINLPWNLNLIVVLVIPLYQRILNAFIGLPLAVFLLSIMILDEFSMH